MNPSASELQPAELAALLHFYADAGVEWMLEDEPVDRIAEFEAQKAARAAARAPASARDSAGQGQGQAPGAGQNFQSGGNPGAGGATTAPRRAAPASSPAPSSVAVPDGEAVAAARFAAEGAHTLAELKAALDAFNGCNLKNSARSTVFASGDPSTGIMVIGPMPNADDDRDGLPFAGRPGELMGRMLAAIGLTREGILSSNVIPWRPPGNRMPSQAELDICRPFIERQIALAQPRVLLLLGNFPARFFLGGSGTIHTMRGEWRSASVGNSVQVPALATFHPQELLAAPSNKALAWQDLLTFKSRMNAL